MRKKRKISRRTGSKRNLPHVSRSLLKKTNKQFTVVGLGGSAGSLDAFERFFRNMPPNSGMAFVLVAHLDPTHKGMLPELLQRRTKMRVIEAEDGMNVAPDTVNVIPSNKDLSLLNGKLRLFEPSKSREKIFEPFFTTKSKGTGLGLAVCREIIDLHKGKIEIQSVKGKGTTFTITLPVKQPLAAL